MNENILEQLLFQMTYPGNEILCDDEGQPSVMVRIPKQTYADLGLGMSDKVHPAFLVNGQEVEAVYISKYANVIKNGRAYSLPGEKPAGSMDYDEAMDACTKKGPGWHLMTKAEWAMLAQWCLNNQTLPKGNCEFGKDISERGYKALPADPDKYPREMTLTGTGPLTWSHDGTMAGIWDLKGNIGEWVGGLRTVYGELQLLKDNDGADSQNSQSADSSCWMAVDGTTGAYVIPDGNGTTKNTLKLSWDGQVWKWVTDETVTKTDKFYGCAYEKVACGEGVCEEAKLLLQAFALYKVDGYTGSYGNDQFFADSGAAEKFFGCGGHFKHKTQAGIFCAHGTTARTATSATRGFRSAYVKLKED